MITKGRQHYYLQRSKIVIKYIIDEYQINIVSITKEAEETLNASQAAIDVSKQKQPIEQCSITSRILTGCIVGWIAVSLICVGILEYRLKIHNKILS